MRNETNDLEKRLRDCHDYALAHSPVDLAGEVEIDSTIYGEAADRIEEQERLLNVYRAQNDIRLAQANRINALAAALREIVSLDHKGRWFVALHGDADVTDIIGSLLTPEA